MGASEMPSGATSEVAPYITREPYRPFSAFFGVRSWRRSTSTHTINFVFVLIGKMKRLGTPCYECCEGWKTMCHSEWSGITNPYGAPYSLWFSYCRRPSWAMRVFKTSHGNVRFILEHRYDVCDRTRSYQKKNIYSFSVVSKSMNIWE